MTPQELKNSILQLAIQGKLVEQRPEEGTAEELYKQIQAEKQALIKSGKIKKEKPLPEITEDEIPFEIPESWKWVRLGNIGYTNIGLTYSPKDIADKGTIVLRSSNIQNSKMDYVDIVYVSMDIPENKMCYEGDILICARNGSKHLVGKSAIVDRNGMSFGAFMAIYRSKCNEYILQVINSAYFRNSLLGETSTTTINQITQNMLKSAVIPLPPLAEQKRIVAKIEELLPLIERYEKAWSRLEDFNKRFPGDMQKSILQMAIQGKLVEQRPEEGTGEELYHQIQTEKQALIKAGKIKKGKSLPEITEDEIPFEIPGSWKWVRLGVLSDITGGYAFKSTDYTSNGIRVVRISDFNENGFVNTKIVRHPFSDFLRPFLLEEKNILLCMTGGTVGKSFFVTKLDETMMTNQRVATIKAKYVVPEYVNYNIIAPLVQRIILHSKNSTNDNISMDTIKLFPIPLPPLAEQKRIVARLEELLPLCEKLK